ncbi:MAG: methyltransferase domain-containing protein [Acidimicrobiia bacterium]|nr:methyltransferase domain-containing protein [Acidimicrobiia bacterium]
MIRPVERDTVAVYEKRAAEWSERRPVRVPELARALGARVADGAIRIDLGCGAGKHLAELGRPIVAFDAARAMLAIAHEAASDAWCVQGDLESLPFRRGSLGGSWARASYLHVRRDRLPWALTELHRALAVEAPAAFTFRHGRNDGPIAGDDFPGRFFAEWTVGPLRDVIEGAGFAVQDVAHDGGEWITVNASRARTLPDYVGPEMRVLVCGLNPSVYAADVGVGFARPGNRFWPAALAARLVSRDRDPAHALQIHGIGMTDLSKRATRSADELSKQDYVEGVARVERLVTWLKPAVVCFVGFAGWRAAVDPKARAGEQPNRLGGARVYVMPNPSGLNTHSTTADLADHLRAALELSQQS